MLEKAEWVPVLYIWRSPCCSSDKSFVLRILVPFIVPNVTCLSVLFMCFLHEDSKNNKLVLPLYIFIYHTKMHLPTLTLGHTGH
jgi:hypothetical protein